MYSYDDEFTYTIDGETEYFTCIGNVKIKDNEYIIAESEYGQKKAFRVDEDEEEIYPLDEEEEELVFDYFQRQELDEDPDFGAIDDDYEYESKYIEGNNNDNDEFDNFVSSDKHDFDYDFDSDGLDDNILEDDDNDDDNDNLKNYFDLDDDSFIDELLDDEED